LPDSFHREEAKNAKEFNDHEEKRKKSQKILELPLKNLRGLRGEKVFAVQSLIITKMPG
jgi:hypothetical protein